MPVTLPLEEMSVEEKIGTMQAWNLLDDFNYMFYHQVLQE